MKITNTTRVGIIPMLAKAIDNMGKGELQCGNVGIIFSHSKVEKNII